ncbi:MAG: hypothetical protein BMS9Abin23_0089 [Thermodesulfobacteriota bacterium]|nr:MAG: hypothetical protein BMS9Abin23_0089 [Thermodesulfobacteriota bacterium]
MPKFEVCLKGTNFHIKTNGKVRKKRFYAARFVEADDYSHAVSSAAGVLRSELKDSVVNPPSDQPGLDVVDVSEVYYFQDNMVVESLDNMVLSGEGFLWEEEGDEGGEWGVPADKLQRKLPTFRERIKAKDIHIHSMLIHFTNALYPAAILFLFLYLVLGKEAFRLTYFYLMVFATVTMPLSYASGILQWRRKYQGAMIRIFYSKIRYGLLAFVIGAACTLWYYFSPGVLDGGGVVEAAFILLNLSILIPLIYLGHLGAIIVYEGLD